MTSWFDFRAAHLLDYDIKVRAFEEGDAASFARLNEDWIEESFGIEDADRVVLNDPEKIILAPGGYIAIAEQGGDVIGTGGLMVPVSTKSEGALTLELVKMTTAPKARGKGVGKMIIDHLIGIARERQANHIWLETNTKLESARRLYERSGFRTLRPEEMHETPYERCNLQMILDL